MRKIAFPRMVLFTILLLVGMLCAHQWIYSGHQMRNSQTAHLAGGLRF